MGQSAYNTPARDKTIKVTNTPSHWYSYLPEGTPFTTESIPANTPTKVKVPTTIISAQDFAVVDIGGGDLRVQYQGAETITVRMLVATGMRSSVNNVLTKTRIYKNDTPIVGAYIPRKIGTGADTGAFPLFGVAELVTGDTISFWVEGSLTTTFTFDGVSIIVDQKGLII